MTRGRATPWFPPPVRDARGEPAVAAPAGAAVALLAVTATEVWSLRVAVAALVALSVGALLVVGRTRGVERVCVLLLTGSVAAAPANALSVGLPPGPALLALALAGLACVAVHERRAVRLPAWLWPLPAAIVLICAVHLLAPTELSYLAGRVIDADIRSAAELARADVAGAVNGYRWLVAALALPIAVCLASAHRPELPGRLADAWAIGATVSAAVALLDETGLTTISYQLLDTVDVGGRQAGLSVQPNHLAVTAAMALPLVVWRALTASTGRRGAGWTLAALVLGGGLLVTESRGGLVVGVVAVATVLSADRRARGALPVVVGLGLAGLVVLVALRPDVLTGVAEQLRLSGADSAVQSDAIRRAIADQAIADFAHDPVRGIGLDVIVQGHNIYLELLAAGGIVLLAGFVLTFGGALLEAGALRAVTGDLSAVIGLCTVGWLLGGLVENQVADLYLYVPPALIAGMRAAARAARARTAPIGHRIP